MSAPQPCTVLVAEDETPILNNVVHKLETLDLPLRVVGTASDGQEAIALIERSKPQIVITDIRMPGMDGLELCQYLFEHHPTVKIVVLSGYSEFEYAQAAIRYHVSDYLLKPVNTQKLRATMEKLCGEVQENRRALQQQYLTRQLSGGGGTGELPFQFEHGAFGLYLICLGNLLHFDGGVPEPFRALWVRAGMEEFLEQEPLDCWWLIEEKSPNEQMLLIAGHAPTLFQRLHKYLSERLRGVCAVNLCEAGQEVTFREIRNTSHRMREFLHNALVPCANGIFTLGTPAKPECPRAFRQQLQATIHDRTGVAFKAALHAALWEFKRLGATQRRLEEAALELVRAFDENRRGNESKAKCLFDACCRDIALATDSSVLYERLEVRLDEAFRQISGVVTEDLAAAVKAHIDEHYREEINMESLAEAFHFSESYIARLFRVQYGAPPVKYLLQRRIERAKDLIAGGGDLSLGAVAEMVGYSDQHYFSRLFRVSTGMSPSEYKIQSSAT